MEKYKPKTVWDLKKGDKFVMKYISNEQKQGIDSIISDLEIKTGFERPSQSIYELAELLGYNVIITDLPKGIKAAVKIQSDNSVRLLLADWDTSQSRMFSLAHEIGHVILHRETLSKDTYRLEDFGNYNSKETILQESEANYFAGCILVPLKVLSELKNKSDLPINNFIQRVAKYFTVNEIVITKQLEWLN